MNRRQFVRVTGTGTLGLAAVTAFKCPGGPNLDPKFQIALTILGQIDATLKELNITGPLGLIAKVTKIIGDVQTFYKNADFPSAIDGLNQIVAPGGLFDQVLDDAGIAQSNVVKGLLIAFRGALTVIAVILESQSTQPVVAARIRAASASDAQKIDNVRKLADGKKIDAALKSLRF